MMLKKTIFILTLFSSNVIAATVELGFENEQYNYAYRSADVFMPYIKSNFNLLLILLWMCHSPICIRINMGKT